MKFFTITCLALASQANAHFLRHLQQCPPPGTGVSCPSVVIPVACGDNFKCEYDNECLANAAGFVNCLPVEDFCPTPGPGMSCPSDKKEVICNQKCTYDNSCLANAAGFAHNACVEVPQPCNPMTGANCPPTTVPPPVTNPPLPPCLPTTTGPCNGSTTQVMSKSAHMPQLPPPEQCPMPGAGVTCPLDYNPVGCGDDHKCVYDNDCLANAAGFVGCLPIEEQCQIPGTGMSCTREYDPVKCGSAHHPCVYDNPCMANAAGFATGSCTTVNPEVPPPCNPKTGANCPMARQKTATSATANVATAAKANDFCPQPGTGMSCPSTVAPVACGHGYNCIYDNSCLANAAGFVGCLPLENECPVQGTGMACPASIDPVKCGTNHQCVYDNHCLANDAGFVGCVLVNPPVPPPLCNATTSANCPPVNPLPPCHPTTTGPCDPNRRAFLRG